MNNDTFLIEDSDLEQARVICSEIEDSTIRCRAVANALAADITAKYFQEIEVDIESGLHKIPQVLDKIDIADVYLKEAYIDVRVYFKDNELWVPKSHFDTGILPLAYMFIKLDEGLSGGLVTGFVLSNTIDPENVVDGYLKIEETDLISYYDVEPHLVTKYIEDLPEDFESKIFDYLDNKLGNDELKEFYNVLINNSEARNLLQNIAKAQTIFNFVSIAPQKEDSTVEKELDILEESDGLDLGLEASDDLIAEEDNSVDMLEESDGLDLGLEASDDLIAEEDNSVDMLEESDGLDLGLEASDDLIAEEDNSVDMLEESDGLDLGLEASDDLIVDEDKVTSEEFEIEEASSISDGSFEVDYTQNDKQEEFQKVNEVLSTSVYEEESTNNTQYSTNVTPSIESYEDESVGDNLEELLNNDASIFEENNNVDGDEDLNAENTAQIEELFSNNELGPDVDTEETYVQPSKKGGSKIIPLFGMLAIVAAIGYFGYTKFMNGELSKESLPVQNSVREKKNVSQKPVSSKPSKVAMPIETVDNVESKPQVDEGNAISLPDIEKNLDASILVSNLSVSWEVPASYLSSNTAKRYFTKMGKIIQLNLKTELLLLNKQPVTNKIRLELEFNKNSNKFDVKAVTTSSGEKVVDEVITQTVNNALNLNIKTNMSNFGNMAGNPVLIINL